MTAPPGRQLVPAAWVAAATSFKGRPEPARPEGRALPRPAAWIPVRFD